MPNPPSDSVTASLLESLCEHDSNELQHYLGELFDTIEYTTSMKEPEIFAYGRLINFLTDGLDHALLIHTCAAALWKLHGQNQAKIYPIKTDKDENGNS